MVVLISDQKIPPLSPVLHIFCSSYFKSQSLVSPGPDPSSYILAFRASSRWEDFTFTLRQDWSNNLRANSPVLKSAASIPTTRVMAAKTPVFLCVIAPSPVLYETFPSYFILTPHHSLSHGGVSQHPAGSIRLTVVAHADMHLR